MNWLDIVLLIVIVASVVASMTKGFSREVIGLVAAVAALFAGLWFYGTAGSFLLPYVSSKGVANLCGFVLVFFGVIAAGALVSIIAGHLIKATGLSFIDRLFGVVFGLGRGMVIAVGIVLAILTFAPGVQAGSPPASSRPASSNRRRPRCPRIIPSHSHSHSHSHSTRSLTDL